MGSTDSVGSVHHHHCVNTECSTRPGAMACTRSGGPRHVLGTCVAPGSLAWPAPKASGEISQDQTDSLPTQLPNSLWKTLKRGKRHCCSLLVPQLLEVGQGLAEDKTMSFTCQTRHLVSRTRLLVLRAGIRVSPYLPWSLGEVQYRAWIELYVRHGQGDSAYVNGAEELNVPGKCCGGRKDKQGRLPPPRALVPLKRIGSYSPNINIKANSHMSTCPLSLRGLSALGAFWVRQTTFGSPLNPCYPPIRLCAN